MPNADMTRQTSAACRNTLLINIPTLTQQCSQRTPNEPETIDPREIESLQSIIEQRTSFKAVESTNSPLIIDGDDITQSPVFPKPAEIPDSQVCETLSDTALLNNLDTEVSSNSAGCEVSEVSQSAESQTLQGQSGNLMLSENFELVTNETEQAAFEPADSNNNSGRAHGALNDKDLGSISGQAPNGSNHMRAADDIKGQLRVSHCWCR